MDRLTLLFGVFSACLISQGASNYFEACYVDDDCDIVGETCLSLKSLGCSTGYCTCKSGKKYNYDRTACISEIHIPLGSPCTGEDYEKHTPNAYCSYGISTCSVGFSKSGSHCVYNLGKTCTSSADCGLDTPLWCVKETCQCLPSYKRSSTTGLCVPKDAGSPCTADSDCWALSPTIGLGYACVNGACGCSWGYQLAKITDIDMNEVDGTIKATSASYCFTSATGSTFDVAAGGICNIWPYWHADGKVLSCEGDTSGCYVCPENIVPTLGCGYCRVITNTATSNSTPTEHPTTREAFEPSALPSSYGKIYDFGKSAAASPWRKASTCQQVFHHFAASIVFVFALVP